VVALGCSLKKMDSSQFVKDAVNKFCEGFLVYVICIGGVTGMHCVHRFVKYVLSLCLCDMWSEFIGCV
jgi:hypothetical protein